MPQTGQIWQTGLFTRSALLRRFLWLDPKLDQRTAWPSLEEYTALAEARRKAVAPELKPLAFVEPTPKRSRAPRTEPVDLSKLYDGRIALLGQVPCLPESFHDLFNVVIWSAFPRAKRTLHARQYRALCEWIPRGATRLPGKRLREQDALTVFDEGGSVVVLTAEMHRTWQRLPPAEAFAVSAKECLLFGHALLEHVHHGRPAVRSSALVIVGDAPTEADLLFDWLDRRISERLSDVESFATPGADAVVTIDETGAATLSPNL
jgi:hypothetical protein